MQTISQSSLTTAVSRLSRDRVLEAGKDCSVFHMPIPMFDLRASSAFAGLAHEDKIFSLCSLDRHHTAPGQWREPEPYLHNAENQSFTRQCLEQQLAQALASGIVFGVSVCFYLMLCGNHALNVCLGSECRRLTHCGNICVCGQQTSLQKLANPPTACRDKNRNQLVIRESV